MPTVLTHAAIPLALWCASERGRISGRLLGAGVVAAVLPDADVLAFALHIPYADAFGHRGASHSLLFAGLLAALATLLSRHLHAGRMQALAFVFCAYDGLRDIVFAYFGHFEYTDRDLRLGLKEALTRETFKRRRTDPVAAYVPAGFRSFSRTNLCGVDPRKSPG